MNETDKLIEEQLKKLPPNLQRAINAVPWKALVQEIGKTNVLDVEQIVSLEQETMFIIYAFESPKDYLANIMREVRISEDTALNIAESVADKIFNPILQKSEGSEKTIKTKTKDYLANIMREVRISEDTALNIAESVADKIFNPILQKSEGSEKTIKTKT